jgi:uncharacterized protein
MSIFWRPEFWVCPLMLQKWPFVSSGRIGCPQERADPLIVFDASTLVSAAMDAEGIPHQALRKARAVDTLVMSQAVFDEVFDVLHRPRLQRFLDSALKADVLDQLISGTLWFATTVTVTDCRDAKDDKYLELALAARARLIVSSDEDLLILHPWRGIPILRPAAYLAQAEGPSQ